MRGYFCQVFFVLSRCIERRICCPKTPRPSASWVFGPAPPVVVIPLRDMSLSARPLVFCFCRCCFVREAYAALSSCHWLSRRLPFHLSSFSLSFSPSACCPFCSVSLTRQADRELWAVDADSQQSAMWKSNKFGYGTFGSTRMYEAGYATVESQQINLNLAGFSG